MGGVPLLLHRSGFQMLKSSAGKGFRVFKTNTKSQIKVRRPTTFSLSSAMRVPVTTNLTAGARRRAVHACEIHAFATFGRRRLCALMASEPVLNIMTGLSGKLSQVGTIGVSMGQLQRCMRDGEAVTSWRLAR